MKNNFIWYFCTDEKLMSKNEYSNIINEVIESGFSYIQLRFKKTPKKDIYTIIKNIKNNVIKKNNTKIIINDYWKIARKFNLDGVHIGQNDVPINKIRRKFKNKIIGVSCTNLKEALIAKKNGADYIGIGSIFKTDTKKDAKVIGIKILSTIVDNIFIPTIAIGGINKNNITYILKTNVTGVALISAILKNNKIKDNCYLIMNKINEKVYAQIT